MTANPLTPCPHLFIWHWHFGWQPHLTPKKKGSSWTILVQTNKAGGYHAETDQVLILDVARFKYPPHWVPLKTLWEVQTLRGHRWESRSTTQCPLKFGVLAPCPPPKYQTSASISWHIRGTMSTFKVLFDKKQVWKLRHTPETKHNSTNLTQTQPTFFACYPVLFFARPCCTWTRKPSVHVVLCWSNPMNVSRFLTWLWFGDGPSAVPWRRILDFFGCLNESRRKKGEKMASFFPR